MRFINPSVLFIALRYIKGSRKQHFASFVALLATLGIMIGVSALIVVSSIMLGLQERLKANILSDSAHVVVKAQEEDIPYLLSIPHVIALVPFVQGEAMMQSGNNIAMVNLQASKEDNLYVSPNYISWFGFSSDNNYKKRNKTNSEDSVLVCIPIPKKDRVGYDFGSTFDFTSGNFDLSVNHRVLNDLGIDSGEFAKVRLISTQNARYSPLGVSPVQRTFSVKEVLTSMDNASSPTVIGNYNDVRRFLRVGNKNNYYRLYLTDPFLIDQITPYLDKKYEFYDWRVRYGEFFKAVGLERVTMSTMLCLIIMVAAFNILSSLTMLVSSRINEIAILKTIGMQNNSILLIFILVGMSASIAGSILGVILGIPLAIYSQEILAYLGINIVNGELPIQIDTMSIVLIVIMCLVVSVICTIYPAYYASKTDPARSLINA